MTLQDLKDQFNELNAQTDLHIWYLDLNSSIQRLGLSYSPECKDYNITEVTLAQMRHTITNKLSQMDELHFYITQAGGEI